MDKKTDNLGNDFKGNIRPKSFTKNPIKGTKFTIAISSAKGGVGKSTFAMNFALALKTVGAKVGILDADIYGPSQGMMLGLSADARPDIKNDHLLPIKAHGLLCMSMSFVASERTPAIWRGPMASGAMQQLLIQTDWGELDYLIVVFYSHLLEYL